MVEAYADTFGSREKGLEILLYNVVAFITGWFADREHAEHLLRFARQRRAGRNLQRAERR